MMSNTLIDFINSHPYITFGIMVLVVIVTSLIIIKRYSNDRN